MKGIWYRRTMDLKEWGHRPLGQVILLILLIYAIAWMLRLNIE